jgi:hypothetical protein
MDNDDPTPKHIDCKHYNDVFAAVSTHHTDGTTVSTLVHGPGWVHCEAAAPLVGLALEGADGRDL